MLQKANTNGRDCMLAASNQKVHNAIVQHQPVVAIQLLLRTPPNLLLSNRGLRVQLSLSPVNRPGNANPNHRRLQWHT